MDKIFILVFFSSFAFALPQPCPQNLKVGDHCRIEVKKLHPTQMAVGYLAVRDKMHKVKSHGPSVDYLADNTVLVTLGPSVNESQTIYFSDDHHFLSALYQLNQRDCFIKVEKDYRKEKDFWKKMLKENLVWMMDENGQAFTDFEKLPKTVSELKDDPLRSVVHFLQKEDEIDKIDGVNYYQFKWANFLRGYVGPKLVNFDYDMAMRVAKRALQSKEAEKIPGYRKPRPSLLN